MLINHFEERQDRVLRLLRARDEEALRELFTHYGGSLNALIEPIVGDPALAEEVLHDVLLKVWNGINGYDPDKSRLFTWMARIARNAAVDATRSKGFKRDKKTDSLDDNVIIHERASVTPGIDHIGVAKLLDALDDDHRATIDLLYLKDYTQSEAAKALGIPLGTIKTRSRRAILQLRQLLQSEMIWLIMVTSLLIQLLGPPFGH